MSTLIKLVISSETLSPRLVLVNMNASTVMIDTTKMIAIVIEDPCCNPVLKRTTDAARTNNNTGHIVAWETKLLTLPGFHPLWTPLFPSKLRAPDVEVM